MTTLAGDRTVPAATVFPAKAAEHKASVPFSLPSSELKGALSVFDGRSVRKIPYTTLLDDVCSVRDRLIQAGLNKGAIAGILGENCYEWIVHDLAVHSIGAISVCFPIEEFAGKSAEELGERFGLALLLVTKKTAIADCLPWVHTMDARSGQPMRVREGMPGEFQQKLCGSDVCSVIFSSGTSGRLKALLLSRTGVDATVNALADDWSMSGEDSILVALPLSIFQQRVMIYAALRKDTEILLSNSVNLFRSLKVLRPTIVLGPPALFEAIENRHRALPPLRRHVIRAASAAVTLLPSAAARGRIRGRLYAGAREAFGGRVRTVITGSAPSKLSTLRFFRSAGLPLYQAYGLAEVGFIAWNRPSANRLLSVGRPVIDGSVRIAPDGEIIVNVPHRQAIGYFDVDVAEETRTFLPDGGVATGDIGRFDQDGFLFITGRKKNIILLQSGEKINPEPLEAALGNIRFVERVVVLGGGDLPGLAAIVAIGVDCPEDQEPRLKAEFEKAVEALNARVQAASRISRFHLTRTHLTPESGLVTRNLKLDRTAIRREFERDLKESTKVGQRPESPK